MIALSFIVVAGCEEKKQEQPVPPPAAPAAAPAAPAAPAASPGAAAAAPAGAGSGSVKGVVTLTGAAPKMEEQNRKSDPFCAKTKAANPEVVSAGGKLANVIVHINGAPAAEGPKEPATIEQKTCNYTPHVQGIVAGQTLQVKNGDPTLHNVHTYKGTSTLFNQAQVPGTPAIEKKFTDNGAILKFKCDVHQWMTGYVWVQNNPYFAVTGDDGSFEIKNVPAGKYEIEAWHERFGTKKGEVTVAPNGTAEVKFDFDAASKG
jgi:plastocyanin